MGKTIVGVDIGSSGIRAVEVQGYDTAKPAIVRRHEVPLPENSVRRGEVVEQGTVSTALRRLWSGGGFKSKQVVLGVGGQRVFARELSLPRAPIEHLRESLPFHVQELLPVPVSDVLLDFYPISEEGGESGPMVNGLLVAGLKDAVTANVATVMAAGLHPVHVDLVPFALARALAPRRTPTGRDMIVALGANSTDVVVVDNGVPKFVRILPNGGDDITRALASRLQWSPDQADQAKRALGMGSAMLRPEDRPIIEIVYEVVGELISGIRNTLSYYATTKPSEPVQRIVLTGGGAGLGGLPATLGEVTRMPVVVSDGMSIAQSGKSGRSKAPVSSPTSFTTALGLALGSHA